MDSQNDQPKNFSDPGNSNIASEQSGTHIIMRCGNRAIQNDLSYLKNNCSILNDIAIHFPGPQIDFNLQKNKILALI